MNISASTLEKINYVIVFSFSLFFIIYNIINKKYRNIILFITLSIVLKICKLTIINSIVVAYVLCLIYGIIMNYHLLDNYENNPNTKQQKMIQHKNTFNKSPYVFSERILFKYVNENKKNDPNFVITRTVRLSDLKPIKDKLSINKVQELKNKTKVIKTPILITNDNYIIDGHLRYYILKSKAKNDKNLNSIDPSDFITCNIIGLNYKDFIKDIQDFKAENNFSELSRFTIDKDKLNDAKKALTSIQDNVSILTEYYKDLEKLQLV